MADHMRLEPSSPLVPIEDRGPMMNAKQIAKELFHGQVNARWVRDTVPGKIPLSHSKVVWYRKDVERWIATRQEHAA